MKLGKTKNFQPSSRTIREHWKLTDLQKRLPVEKKYQGRNGRLRLIKCLILQRHKLLSLKTFRNLSKVLWMVIEYVFLLMDKLAPEKLIQWRDPWTDLKLRTTRE